MNVANTKYTSQHDIKVCYEGRSKRFATQYDAQMTRAKFLCYYST